MNELLKYGLAVASSGQKASVSLLFIRLLVSDTTLDMYLDNRRWDCERRPRVSS